MMDLGEIVVKGVTTFNDGVDGVSQNGYSSLSNYVANSTPFTLTIGLDRATYTWGSIILSPGYTFPRSKSCHVLFTTSSSEASSTNCDGAYSKAYSKIMGSNMLSDHIFSPGVEIQNVYISSSRICVTAARTSGTSTGTFNAKCWWRVYQA